MRPDDAGPGRASDVRRASEVRAETGGTNDIRHRWRVHDARARLSRTSAEPALKQAVRCRRAPRARAFAHGLRKHLPVFVELSARSNFSFLRGGSSPRAIIARAAELGY